MFRFVFAAFLTVTASAAVAEIAIQEITSDGGINAWVVEEPAIPFVALELRFRGGTSLDEEGKRGPTRPDAERPKLGRNGPERLHVHEVENEMRCGVGEGGDTQHPPPPEKPGDPGCPRP